MIGNRPDTGASTRPPKLKKKQHSLIGSILGPGFVTNNVNTSKSNSFNNSSILTPETELDVATVIDYP